MFNLDLQTKFAAIYLTLETFPHNQFYPFLSLARAPASWSIMIPSTTAWFLLLSKLGLNICPTLTLPVQSAQLCHSKRPQPLISSACYVLRTKTTFKSPSVSVTLGRKKEGELFCCLYRCNNSIQSKTSSRSAVSDNQSLGPQAFEWHL